MSVFKNGVVCSMIMMMTGVGVITTIRGMICGRIILPICMGDRVIPGNVLT